MAATAQVVALDEVSLCDIVVLKEAKITKDKVVATLFSFCYLVAENGSQPEWLDECGPGSSPMIQKTFESD